MRTMLRWAAVAVVTLHGLIHLMGVVKGFGWADVSQLRDPIGPAVAVGWLLAAVLVVAAAAVVAVRNRLWWAVTGLAALCSQAVILSSWSDAKAGTVVNVAMLLAAVVGYLAQGPRSFAVEYSRRVETAVIDAAHDPGVVTESDLTGLPAPVAGYLRRTGAVGQPRAVNLRATFRGRIRGAPGKPWMRFTGEQFNSLGAEKLRVFHLTARLYGIPVDVLHVFSQGKATMRGRAGYAVPIVDAAGPDLDRAETVTLFNDLCLLAPPALVDAPVTWQPIDDHRARGTLTLGQHAVTAELVFDDQHDLIDFVSDDRLRADTTGRDFTAQRWSTPVDGYRAVGPRRLVTGGQCRWHAPEPEGEFAYLEFHLDQLTYNVTAPAARDHRSPTDGPEAVEAARRPR